MAPPLTIEPLEAKYLEEACAVADETFKDHDAGRPSDYFRASLAPQEPQSQKVMNAATIKSLEYWVGVVQGKVVAVIGLYTYAMDEHQAVWMGYLAVDRNARGNKYGSAMIDFVIEEARRKGKAAFRLYTSTHPAEARANQAYEHRGFKEKGRWQNRPNDRHFTIARELVLDESIPLDPIQEPPLCIHQEEASS